jgi:hypothetical protein
MDKRKVLFTSGMSADMQLIITDAPKEEIEKYCSRYVKSQEEGIWIEPFDTLKFKYYVKELHDSEMESNNDNVEIIGYDEVYCIYDYD